MAIETTSCNPPNPLVKLDEGGQASVLNYNLPAATCFGARGYMPLDLPAHYFNEKVRQPPAKNPWDIAAEAKPPAGGGATERPAADTSGARNFIENILINVGWMRPEDPVTSRRVTAAAGDPFEDEAPSTPLFNLGLEFESFAPILNIHTRTQRERAASARDTPRDTLAAGAAFADARQRVSEPRLVRTTVAEMNRRVQLGQLPLFTRTLYGNVSAHYVKEPEDGPKPRLVIIEHYEVCSYLGDYGAGRTIKTFSLLPGEKTTISVRTYRQREETRSKTENVLDSFTEASADELENIMNTEAGWHSSSQDSTSQTIASTETSTVGGGGSVGINLFGIVKLGGEASGSGTDTTGTTTTTNSARGNNVDLLSKAMDRHVTQSSAARTVEVNTETQETARTLEEEEVSTVRQVENINHSRTLNFVFRQMSQEYLTITYLKDVSIGFTNGYPNENRVARLDNLEGLLREVLRPERVEEVRRRIVNELCNVFDHEGARHSFVEKRTEELFDCEEQGREVPEREVPEREVGGREDLLITQPQPAPPAVSVYYRKRRNLSQTVRGKTVGGVVLDVSQRILRTDAVIVEALLGQGEALDCYNIRLQDAAVTRALLQNAEKEQAIKVIDSIADPAQRAEAYKRVFGDCCPTPQTVKEG